MKTPFRAHFDLLTVALFAVLHPGEAKALSNPWLGVQGHSTCGGIDQNGNLQPACGYSAAIFHGQQIKVCPKGSFHDQGKCYACPDGFHRNLKPVTSNRACQQPAPVHTAPATFLGSGKCSAGSFFDPRNGGECWQCPPGYHRTAAKVDQWNACGKIGKKAHTAYFEHRACPVKGSIRDPRHGGECWICPPDYSRTANPVTGARACKTAFNFTPAVDKGIFKCAAGQIKSPYGGGTCWTCPPNYRRTVFHGIKSPKACFNKKMAWVMPKRQLFGIFGLGKGADDILAKLIADRTQINETAKKFADVGGVNEATAVKNAWHIIDTKPWESSILATLLEGAVINAAQKPTNQRTASEKNLLAQVSLLIQWDRQFIAHQAKQAYDIYIAAEKKHYDQAMSHTGAAVVYADNVYTPPDWNQTLTNTLQAGAPLLVGAPYMGMTLKVPFFRAATLPFRLRGESAAKDALTAVGRAIATEGSEMSEEAALEAGSAAVGGASAAFAVAATAAVMVAMELDKYGQIAKAEGQLRQSIDLANRPVDIGRMLQMKNGEEEFSFHFADVITTAATATKPSAYFKTRLAYYKTGQSSSSATSTQIHVQGAVSAKDMGNVTASQQSTMNVVSNVRHQATTPTPTVGTPAQAPAPAPKVGTPVQAPAPAPKVGTPVQAPSPPTTAATATRKTVVLFNIVASTGACLQAFSNRVRLIACQVSKTTQWISTEGLLKSAANFGECLTSRPGAPYMTACRKGFPPQLWTLTDAGTIQSGVDTCLEARGSSVTTAHCQPTNKMQKRKARVVK